MLGAGAALACGALFLMSQGGFPGEWTWGPPKHGVINLFNPNVAATNPGSSSTLVVYTVPGDRWLTITDAQAAVTAFGGCPGGGNYRTVRWAERYNGVITEKGYAASARETFTNACGFGTGQSHTGQLGLPFTPSGSEVGWVFRPGSEVVLINTGLQADWGSLVPEYSVLGFTSRN
jgi:hypothetical protein